jgi:hypothetical protein
MDEQKEGHRGRNVAKRADKKISNFWAFDILNFILECMSLPL